MKTVFYKIRILSILLLFSFCIPTIVTASQTDFYVANALHGGNDNNPGTIDKPWETMSKVFHSETLFVPGTHIYFLRGDVFTGILRFSSNALPWGGNSNSGTAGNPITIGAYGNILDPLPIMQYDHTIPITTTGSNPNYESRDIMRFGDLDYWTIENINFTDTWFTDVNHYTPSNITAAIHMGYPGDDPEDALSRCNHFLIQNCQMSLCGLGVVINGDYNTVTKCVMSKFNNVKSTLGVYDQDHPILADYEDYGANGVTISGSYNEISYNDIRDAWAESLDFAWNGGACEMVNVCTYNKIIYNTFYDCGGIAEFGGLIPNTMRTGENTFAYNKIVNCGGLTYCNIDQEFAITVSNNMWYNNVVVENTDSRFSGVNAGTGVQDPVALSHLVPDHAMFQYGSTPVSGGAINNVKNNIFQISSGMEHVYRTNDLHLDHSNNIYKLSNCIVNTALTSQEVNVTPFSTNIFTNTSDANPVNWDFYPLAGSPQIAAGLPFGFTLDFNNHSVSLSTPTDGILEYLGLTTITTSTVSPLTYCEGTSVSVPFTIDAQASAGNVFTAQISNDGINWTSIGTLTSVNAGTITAVLPAGMIGSGYRIRVISSTPSIIGSNNGMDITINPQPVASVIEAESGVTFCQPGTVSLSGNDHGGVWNTGSTSSYINVTTSGNYYVTNTNSCNTVTSNVITVTANPSPHVVAGNVSGCEGTAITLAGSPAGGTFSIANPYTGPSTTYTYTYTNSFGCTRTANGTVTVNPLPTVSAGTYAAMTSIDAPITLTGSPAGGTFSGAGVSGNTFNPQISGAGNIGILYTYTNANGCTAVGTTTITVNCGFSAGAVSGPGNICAFLPPSTATATYTVSAMNASSYTWVLPTGANFVSGQGTNTIVVSFASFTSGYVGVTVGNGCGGASQFVKMYLNNNVPSTPGVITGPTNACLYIGTSVHVTYSVVPIANASSYNWTFTNGADVTTFGLTNGPSIELIFNSWTSGNTIGCQAVSNCGTSVSTRYLTINKGNPSQPSAITGPVDVCNYIGTTTQVTYSVSAQTNANSFTWTYPANVTIVSGLTTNALTVTFNAGFTSGAFTVAAVNTCATSAIRTITVSKLPPTPGAMSGTATPCNGAVNINYSVPNVPGYIYYWTLPLYCSYAASMPGQNIHSNSIYVDFDPSWNDSQIKVYASNNCGNSSNRVLNLINCPRRGVATPPVVVAEDANTKDAIYPNPSDGNFTITLDKVYAASNVKVEITNNSGQSVYQADKRSKAGMITMDLRGKLTTGLYIVTCIVNGERIVKKLIIAK